MRTRTSPRTDAEKQAIAAGRRRAWARAKQVDALTAEVAFRLMLRDGITTADETAAALGFLDRALQCSNLDGGRRRSLEMYQDAIESGRRIAIKTVVFDDGPPDGGEGIVPALLAQLAACI